MTKQLGILLIIAFVIIAMASFLPHVVLNIWFIEILSNFKVQLVILSIFIFLLTLFLRRNRLICLLSLVLIIWNFSFIYKLYIPNNSLTKIEQSRTSIVCINLFSDNSNSQEVINYIKNRDPDVLILLELTPKWTNELGSIIESYSFKKSEIRSDNFGIGLYSKIDSKLSILRLDESQVPSIRADIKLNGDSLSILATHPFPPVGKKRFEIRNSHLENLAIISKSYSEHLIVVGDLNTSSFSKHFKNLLNESQLIDSRNGFGILATWPANFTPLKTTIDHFLVSKNIQVHNRGVGSEIGSDHLPIFMEFSIKK